MNTPIVQLLVLAGIAIFLILRLRSVLGTRDGFEKPKAPAPANRSDRRPDFEVIEGGPDLDITDHVSEGSPAAEALAQMKRADPAFNVGEFLGGARGAYEMILMGFENGDIEDLRDFLSPEVYESFEEVIEQRRQQGLTIEASFAGVREMTLVDATFDEASRRGEVTVKYVGELTQVVKNAAGEVIEGSATSVTKQKDVWTYGRIMGSDDPNWQLVATDE
ncbi:Tim44/TimA family putative adaptor protein [Citreicella sp. C3M06]|uniref:Tim44/TimA family putative adaptor protein n=1 Tax=Citreicella sp. C3M06 TaxID=2841564 RepID=UPI001C0A2506|nr:Tim44/TimA family putative adaptor protein [Citreicella sp. C3M06]MBU2960676.1 Tim44/TimA family putative adaptor protein [Citreicella sp. C3M06]